MSRQNIIVAALGAAAISAFPVAGANAQSGDALAHAEHVCIDYGVPPSMPDFDTCVGRAALAFDRGRPVLAERQAVLVREANELCRSYGIAPATLGYNECVNNEIARHASASSIRYVPREAPRATATIDAFGFHYDSDGNLIDRDGYPIRAVQ